MKGKTYDLAKLSDKFDTDVSTRFYYNKQEYFDALSSFLTNYNRDLGNYTPAFVINDDLSREEFMRECFEIRAELTRLGLSALLELLSQLEDAARKRNFQEFSDGQVNFRATLEICKSELLDATTRWKMTLPDMGNKK
ncbi:MAG: hypothetical protein FWF80_00030 [Defluviitaleaceae bacterium]|nr:hypothetical protein [Defluviitaleaceae bacterium]